MIDELTFRAAQQKGRRLLARGPLAVSARLDSARIYVELSDGCAFAFPVDQVLGLAGASLAELDQVEVTGAGLGLYWPALDVDLYVPNLVKGVLGARKGRAQIGSLGRQAGSPRKGGES